MRRCLLAFCALLVVPAPAAASCEEDPARVAPRQDLALEVVELVNAHRARIGVAPLGVSPALMRSALWKSNHMATLGYFEHDDPAPPVARGFGERVRACGYGSGFAGENIAYGSETAVDVMRQWLDSSGHRSNIENPEYTQIGVGAAGPSRHWTQNFGGGAEEPANPPPVASPDVIELAEDTSDVALVIVNDADLPGDWLHVTRVEQGEATPDGRGIEVTPPRDFNGTYPIDHAIADVVGQASTAVLTVRVTPVNDAPVATSDRVRLRRHAGRLVVRVLRNDRDADGDPLTVRLVRRPRYGTVRAESGRLVYRPRRRRWPGADTLRYRAVDPSGATSVSATVRIRGARRR